MAREKRGSWESRGRWGAGTLGLHEVTRATSECVGELSDRAGPWFRLAAFDQCHSPATHAGAVSQFFLGQGGLQTTAAETTQVNHAAGGNGTRACRRFPARPPNCSYIEVILKVN
jgi:hypothetical protein